MKIAYISTLLLYGATIYGSSPVYALIEKDSIQQQMRNGLFKNQLEQLRNKPRSVVHRAVTSINRRPVARRPVTSVNRRPVVHRAVTSVNRRPVVRRAVTSVNRRPVVRRAVTSVNRTVVRRPVTSVNRRPTVIAPRISTRRIAPIAIRKANVIPKTSVKNIAAPQRQSRLATQNPVNTLKPIQLMCGGDYKLGINALAVGQRHDDVERSGVILLKDYGYDEPGKPGSRYAVILGHDANLDFWNFQAGKCEKSHKYTTETAKDELYEETGGAVKMTAKELSHQPYIYSAQKQLFFVRNDQLSVNNIKQACLKARSNFKLPHSQREVDNVAAVSLPDLLKVAENIRQQNIRQSRYTLYSRIEGYRLDMEGYYMRMIANRLPEVRQIFNSLLPGAGL